MIAFLSGKLRMAGLNYVVVDAGGVGYRVAVPLSLMSQMAAVGENVELFIHTQVRERTPSSFSASRRWRTRNSSRCSSR